MTITLPVTESQEILIWVLVVGAFYLVRRLIRGKGLLGALYGAPVAKTLGEVDLGRQGPLGGYHLRVKVQRLKTSDEAVGLAFVWSSFGSRQTNVVSITRNQALELSAVLWDAGGDVAARQGAIPSARATTPGA